MPTKDKSVEEILGAFQSFLHAANLKKTGDELLSAFRVLVTTYAAIKYDTEEERRVRDVLFKAICVELKKEVETKLAGLKNGENYILTEGDRKEIAGLITVPVVEKIVQVELQPIVTVKEIPNKDTAQEISGKLNTLQEAWLELEAVKGLRDALRDLEKRIMYAFAGAGAGGGAGGRDLIKDIDISDQFDGVLKTFPIHAVYNIISVDLSSYPYGSLRKGSDYTYTPTSITFGDDIVAATQLSSGQKCIITAVIA